MSSVANRFELIEIVTETASVRAGEGLVWEAEILKPGISINNYNYTREFIQESAREFEGAPCFLNHQPTVTGSVEGLMGYWRNIRADGAMKGELHLLETERSMGEKLAAILKAGQSPGISISIIAGIKKVTIDKRAVMEPQRIIAGTPRSADIVMFPAAGGRVLRALAGTGFEEALTIARKKYQTDFIRENNDMNTGTAEVREEVDQLKRDLEASQGRLLLNEKLTASKLPKPGVQLVQEHFADRVPTSEEIDKKIKSVREALAAMIPNGTRATGGAAVMLEPEDKTQIALDKLFGVNKDSDGNAYSKSIVPFGGIREAYSTITGDRDVKWNEPVTRGKVTEEWNSSGFASALGNTLYRRLIQDYMEVDYGIDWLIPPREPHRIPLKDFRTHEVVRVGYMNDLPQTDPEQVDWPEITAPTDEKAQLAAVQFGGIVSVTRKAVINDDIGLVSRIASRIGRSARRTMAQRIFNLILNNAAIYDGGNFFNATATATAGGHANLGTTALSTTELAVIRTAMRNQTEKDSNKKIGFGPYLLVVPNALESLAITENERAFLDSNMTPNPVRYMFGRTDNSGVVGNDGIKPDRIIVSPMLTDVNDWYVFANPDQVQTFEMGFLQGRSEPELLIADNQLVGKAFTSDRIQYKVRHEYEITVVDFRGAYKESVA